MNVEHPTSNVEHRSGQTRKGTSSLRASQYDLEERLLVYAARVVQLVETLPQTRSGHHLGNQLLRSGTSPLLNHGEAQAAESRKDFIHKTSICLKELRESHRTLRLIHRVPLVRPPSKLDDLLKETDELIRIFVASIKTARQNDLRRTAE